MATSCHKRKRMCISNLFVIYGKSCRSEPEMFKAFSKLCVSLATTVSKLSGCTVKARAVPIVRGSTFSWCSTWQRFALWRRRQHWRRQRTPNWRRSSVSRGRKPLDHQWQCGSETPLWLRGGGGITWSLCRSSKLQRGSLTIWSTHRRPVSMSTSIAKQLLYQPLAGFWLRALKMDITDRRSCCPLHFLSLPHVQNTVM